MLFAEADIQQILQQWAHDLLTWVGFGTLVGLLAKAIMPGRDPGGSIATLLMGIGGTIVGCGSLMFFYRLLAGRFFVEGERASRVSVRAPHRRRRQAVVEYDEA
jgi:uncharacterized membrane protein YeaQ/YmgE (transglycosylase-associated protein family)